MSGGLVPGPVSGGASLPTASAAGEALVSTGAGTTYAATPLDEVVIDGMKLALTGEPAGTTPVADGAGDLAATSAVVSGLLAATTAAGARTAIGTVATPTSGTLGARPASPAAGDTYYATDYDVVLVCAVAGTWRVQGADKVGVTLGPFTGDYNTTAIKTAVAGASVGPTFANGTSFALGFWLSARTGVEQVLWSAQAAGDGFILGQNAGGSGTHYPYLFRTGVPEGKAALAAACQLGANTLAVDIAADGLSFSWSVNGSTAATVATTGTYTPPAGGAYTVFGNYQPAGTAPLVDGSIAWAQSWSSLLGGAALAAVSADYASLLPGNPGAATSTWAYLAAKHPGGLAAALAHGSGAGTSLVYTGLASKRVQRL